MQEEENRSVKMSVNLEFAAILIVYLVFSLLLGLAACSW
jgi:hypothetical protein